MKLINKQYIYLALTILVISLPNITLFLIGQDSIVASNLKKIVFLIFSIAIIIIPLLFIKPKYYAFLSLLLSPLLLFEFYNIYTFKSSSSKEAVASLFLTNSYESSELIKSNLQYLFIFLLVVSILVLCMFKLKKTFVLKVKQKIVISIIIISIFSVLYVRDWYIVNTLEPNLTFKKKSLRAKDYFFIKVLKTFPYGDFNKIINVRKGIKKINNYKKTIQNFRYGAKKKDSVLTNETYILVIGETARSMSFSLNGYSRNTNPILSKTANIISYKDVKSAANLTANSLPFILTRATPKNIKPKYNEPAVLNAFKESGFKTYWITNQDTGLNSVFAFYSRIADYYKNIALSIDIANYDGELLPELDKILNDKTVKKKFIVIHTIGSHFRYNYRYPDNFEVFKPTLDKKLSITGNNIKLKNKIVNSYDNSITYTDYFLSEIIERLKNGNSISYMYYVSDHGENLYDDKNELLMHGYMKPTKYVVDVPLIVWYSNSYFKEYPLKVRNLKTNENARISSNYTFQTLLDMANITYKNEDLTRSFSNEKFDKKRIRQLLTPKENVIDLD